MKFLSFRAAAAPSGRPALLGVALLTCCTLAWLAGSAFARGGDERGPRPGAAPSFAADRAEIERVNPAIFKALRQPATEKMMVGLEPASPDAREASSRMAREASEWVAAAGSPEFKKAIGLAESDVLSVSVTRKGESKPVAESPEAGGGEETLKKLKVHFLIHKWWGNVMICVTIWK